MNLGIALVANFSWDNFEYWIAVNDARAVKVIATSNVTTLYYKDWEELVTALL